VLLSDPSDVDDRPEDSTVVEPKIVSAIEDGYERLCADDQPMRVWETELATLAISARDESLSLSSLVKKWGGVVEDTTASITN